MTSPALVDPLPDSSAPPARDPAPARSTIWSDRIAAAGLATLGAALGASQLLQGVYNETAWAPIALGALGLVVALTVAAPRLPPMALLAPVLGLWLWSGIGGLGRFDGRRAHRSGPLAAVRRGDRRARVGSRARSPPRGRAVDIGRGRSARRGCVDAGADARR